MPATIVGEITSDGRRIVVGDAGGTLAEVAMASKHLETITPLVKEIDGGGAMEMPLSWPAIVQLRALYGEHWHPLPKLKAWIVSQTLARMHDDTELTITLPAGLSPRSYQISGALDFANTGGLLCYDDPGTGKTITTILGLLERAHRGHPVLPVLIVCPAGVIDAWVRECRKWAPQWVAKAWRGSPGKRRALLGSADIYVCSYETCRTDAPTTRGPRAPLMQLGINTLVADEAHRMKNTASKQSHAVRRIGTRAQGFIALTGTPITHSPKDQWPALVCLEPGAWEAQDRWDFRYLATIPGDYSTEILGLNEHTRDEFWDCLLGRYRRVSKADVLPELPPKVYSVRTVEIPAKYRAMYDSMERDMRATIPDSEAGEMLEMWAIAARQRLIQLASSACDVWLEPVTTMENGIEVVEQKQHVKLIAPSWKVDELLEIMAERPGKPIVAFAPSKQLMVIAAEAAAAAGYKTGHVWGGQSAGRRSRYVDAFQGGELDLLCVVTQAGGTGLTLTAAGTEVFLQRPYSLIDSIQAEDRSHRIGSEIHDSIEIIDIVAENTIESRVREVLYERGGALSDFVKDPRIIRELLGGEKVTYAPARSQRHLQAVS